MFKSMNTPPRRTATRTLDSRILVIAADGTEPTLSAIRQALDYLGTPYTIFLGAPVAQNAATNRLRARLIDPTDRLHGLYQGIILTTGTLTYATPAGYVSALTEAEWQTLRVYEASFGVRQVSWYTFPSPDYGFGPATPIDTTITPVEAHFTPAGQEVFGCYVNTRHPLLIRDTYMYLAQPLDGATVPLLSDAAGNALAAIRKQADGCLHAVLTFDSNAHHMHAVTLAYGLINWVMNGLFLGARHTFLSAQVDDMFIADDVWGGGIYRMTGDDLRAVVAWQRTKQAQSTTHDFCLDLAFNGNGTVATDTEDTLISTVLRCQNEFKWINHTYTHANLDHISYAETVLTLRDNDLLAQQWRMMNYCRCNLVTPDVSGLINPDFLAAAHDFGIRYVVTDSSQPGYGSPSPNTGIYNQWQPAILMIPRYPNNLFYNVTTPDEWVDEYNTVYRSHWGRDLGYTEIVDKESDTLLAYLLKGDMSPLMFHQANLRAYNGTQTLLSDLLDATLEKYNRRFTLPIMSPTMDQLGDWMAKRMQAGSSHISAQVVPGQSLTLRAEQAATVAITGLHTPDAEVYGGQVISYISLAAGESATFAV